MARSILWIVLVTFSASAGAQALSYNYVQGSYGWVRLNDGSSNADGDGLGISGSAVLNETFHVSGEYQTANMEFGADLKMLELDLGYHTTLSENLDFTAQIGYLDFNIDPGGFTPADDNGFLIGGGVRAAASSNAEIYGGLDYVDFDRGNGELRGNAGFLIDLTDELGIGLKASFWNDVTIYQVNIRYAIGTSRSRRYRR